MLTWVVLIAADVVAIAAAVLAVMVCRDSLRIEADAKRMLGSSTSTPVTPEDRRRAARRRWSSHRQLLRITPGQRRHILRRFRP